MVRFPSLARRAALFSLAGFLIVLAGCGSSKVADNWSKVKTGQSEKEVTDLLGPPKEKNEVDPGAMLGGLVPGADKIGGGLKMTVLYWEDGDKAYVVQLQGEKVIVNVMGSKAEMEKKKKGGK